MRLSRVLVFGAHHDDEIAMSGTIAALAGQGVRVTIAIMTDGSEGYPDAAMKDQIVAVRREEARACDAVLGTHRRICLDRPDMALVNDKETFKECLRLIRQVRPEIIFTHGPQDRHRDHRATSEITREAAWQAGEPVSTESGPPWKTPLVLYYKAVGSPLPAIRFDVTHTAHKRYEALATQESQHAVFGKSKGEFLRKAEQMRQNPEQQFETFWIAETNSFEGFDSFFPESSP